MYLIGIMGPLSDIRIRELFVEGDKETIARANLGLVINLASKLAHKNRTVIFDELVSNALVALANAIKLFELNKELDSKAKFSTYAGRAIWNALKEQCTKEMKYFDNHREAPCPKLDAARFNGPKKWSLDAKTGFEDREIFETEKVELTIAEKYVIARRYGFDGHPASYSQIASEIGGGHSKQRMEQLHKSAIQKLKEYLEEIGYLEAA